MTSNVYPGFVLPIPTFPPVVYTFPNVLLDTPDAKLLDTLNVPVEIFVFVTFVAVIFDVTTVPPTFRLPEILNDPAEYVVPDK